MLLSKFREIVENTSDLIFVKPDGTQVPRHFHITEVGYVSKKFIDCGGTIRNSTVVSMQLWNSIDVWNKLEPNKLASIVNLSIEKLGIEDTEVEIEYQGDTIGKYNLDYKDGKFVLLPQSTTCLAEDKCGIPTLKVVQEKIQSCCAPGSGCC